MSIKKAEISYLPCTNLLICLYVKNVNFFSFGFTLWWVVGNNTVLVCCFSFISFLKNYILVHTHIFFVYFLLLIKLLEFFFCQLPVCIKENSFLLEKDFIWFHCAAYKGLLLAERIGGKITLKFLLANNEYTWHFTKNISF